MLVGIRTYKSSIRPFIDLDSTPVNDSYIDEDTKEEYRPDAYDWDIAQEYINNLGKDDDE